MKKKVWFRALLGFPLGISIGYVITILISLGWGGGDYSPCVPELIATVGSEAGAVAFQAVLCGLLGAGFGGASVVWEQEEWSLVKQTGIYFTVASLVMLPVAYFAYWMEHTLWGVLSYFGVYLLIFAGIWLIQFAVGKRNVKKLNEKLKNQK